jgi:hypothetical protein
LPEGRITGEADLALHGSDCVCVSLILGILLFAHIETISGSEFSDEVLSDSTLTGDRSVSLGSFVNTVDFPISLLLSDLILSVFWGVLRVVLRAEGPPTSITLLTPWGSNLITFAFTMLTATVYSPTPCIPVKL